MADEKKSDEQKKDGAQDVNGMQSQLEDFVRAQMEAAQAAADTAKTEETVAPSQPEAASTEEPAAKKTQNTEDEPATEATSATSEEKPIVAESAAEKEPAAETSAKEEEPAANAAEEEPAAETTTEEKPVVAEAAPEEKSTTETSAEKEPVAEANDEKEDTSEYDDLEKWAAEQLAAMEDEEPTEEPTEAAVEEQDAPPTDPSDMSPEDMEKWAAAQLAEMDAEEETVAATSSAEVESPETQQIAAVSATAGPAGVPAPVMAPGGSFHLRPLHAAIFVLAAMLPAVLTGWILSSRTAATQRATTAEFKQSIKEMEKRLALLKARELNISAERMTQRLTVEDLKNLVKLGDAHFQEGHIAQAQSLYESALEGDKSGKYTDGAHYGLGMCYLKQKEPKKAIAAFRTVVTRYPGSRKLARASVELGALLMKDEYYTQARRLYYNVIGCKDRFGADDLPYVEQAYYAIAKCYQGEVAAIARSRSMSSSVVDTGLPASEGK